MNNRRITEADDDRRLLVSTNLPDATTEEADEARVRLSPTVASTRSSKFITLCLPIKLRLSQTHLHKFSLLERSRKKVEWDLLLRVSGCHVHNRVVLPNEMIAHQRKLT